MKQIIIPREVEEMATLAVDAAFSVHEETSLNLHLP
jgi:hypothetical protein